MKPKSIIELLIIAAVVIAIDIGGSDRHFASAETSQAARTGLIVAVPPVGSVLPYFGDEKSLPENWKLCDGRQMRTDEYPELSQVLAAAGGLLRSASFFSLPDLRGQFLRGANAGRADGFSDEAKQRALGSNQLFSTARPKNAFVTDKQGIHSHTASGTGTAMTWGGGDRTAPWGHDSTGRGQVNVTIKVDNSGEHFHTIAEGGDLETRPNNVAVNWIIRVR